MDGALWDESCKPFRILVEGQGEGWDGTDGPSLTELERKDTIAARP